MSWLFRRDVDVFDEILVFVAAVWDLRKDRLEQRAPAARDQRLECPLDLRGAMPPAQSLEPRDTEPRATDHRIDVAFHVGGKAGVRERQTRCTASLRTPRS